MPGHKAKLSAFFTVIDEVSDILKFKSLDLSASNGDWSNQGSNSGLKSSIEQKTSYQCNSQKWISITEPSNASGTSENSAPEIRVTRPENQIAVQSTFSSNFRKRNSWSLVLVTFHLGSKRNHRGQCPWSLPSTVLQLWPRRYRLDERNRRCKRCWDRIEKIRSETKLQTTTEANSNSGQVAVVITTTTKAKTLEGTRILQSSDRQNQQGSRRQHKEREGTEFDTELKDEACCALSAR